MSSNDAFQDPTAEPEAKPAKKSGGATGKGAPDAPPPSIDEIRAQVSASLEALDPETPIAATVTFPVDPAKESTFLRNIDTLAEATRRLPGLNVFSYHKRQSADPKAAPHYLIYEDWQSRVLFQTQWSSEHLKTFQYSVGDLLTGPPDLVFYYGSDDVGGARPARTGQKQCWNTAGQVIDCRGSGQDGESQAGVAFPEPRFGDNGNGTVTDHLTGLIWLLDADAFGEVTWADALHKANTLATGQAGLSDGSQRGDWRLPNIRELRSLIDYSQVNPILPAGHPFRRVRSAIYWTSTTLAAAPRLAWMTTLGIGPAVFDLKINSCRMWPVRGGLGRSARLCRTGQQQCWDTLGNEISGEGSGQDGDLQIGVHFPTPRFVDNGDGTVMDKLTELVWLKNGNPFGFRTWEQALADCQRLGDGDSGLSDGSRPGSWRLPNVTEIETLIDYGKFGPCLPQGHPFVNVVPTSYWTSTTVTSAPTQAMFTILGVGPSIFENKEHPFLVWPVRDGRRQNR